MRSLPVKLLVLSCLSVFIFLSTFGWRFKKGDVLLSRDEKELSYSLKGHVYKLSNEIGDRSMFRYDNLIKAEDYIAGEFKSFGYTVKFDEYEVSGKKARNIIAVKEGKEIPGEIVIVGAHYDACFNPGADDNASGIAAVLELARMLAKTETRRTVKFIAFVNEEPPFFKTDSMGSRVYARAAKEKGKNIKGVIVFEMIGYYTDKLHSQRYPPFLGPFYPNRGNFVLVVGNISSRNLGKRVIRYFKDASLFPIESLTGVSIIPGIDFSDHASFWEEKYPAVMITDTAFYRNPNYHTSSDTYETLNYESMAMVTAGFKRVILSLANL